MDPELSNAAWWAWFWDTIESWAFLGVIVALAIEFVAHRFVVPHKTKIEAAQAQRLADTQKIAENLAVEAGRLRLALDAANAETARIRSGLASRHVLSSQKSLIESILRGKNLRVEVFTWADGSNEVSKYAQELAAAFNAAGVGPKEIGLNVISPAAVGLTVMGPEPRSDSEVANALAAAQIDFEYTKVLRPADIAPNFPQATRIRVGVRKDPF